MVIRKIPAFKKYTDLQNFLHTCENGTLEMLTFLFDNFAVDFDNYRTKSFSAAYNAGKLEIAHYIIKKTNLAYGIYKNRDV